jgi:hypothetical protein
VEVLMRQIALLAIVLLLVPIATILTFIRNVEGHEAHSIAVTLYDPNPQHLWNRLYAALFVREDQRGTIYGDDSLDPVLWIHSRHLLESESHDRAVHVLDEFLQTHAEKQIGDPLKRAMLQHDLWAVFDWTVQQSTEHLGDPDYATEKLALQTRLAEMMRRLSLTPDEIKSLPDNYRQGITSATFATEYDPTHREQPFLPPDFFDPHGSWAGITPSPDFEDLGVAKMHTFNVSGRSSFLVFVRLPGGHKATMDYFQTLWNFTEPWVPVPHPGEDQVTSNPDLPSFPAGTEMALVRRMNLFDNKGNLVTTPITESVQIRVYREITSTLERYFSGNWADVVRNSGQEFYEIKLTRSLLFSNRNGGLRATRRDETELPTFQQQGQDEIEEMDQNPDLRKGQLPVLQACAACHSGGGVRSFNSRDALFRPNRKQVEAEQSDYGSIYSGDNSAIDWKQNRYDWGLLNGYWRAPSPLR